MGYIYKITNTVNGKVYIGQTIRKPERRMYEHFHVPNKSPYLKNAIAKYGRETFTFEILHTVFDFLLNNLEAEEIAKHKTLAPNGYNLETGGKSNQSVSELTRQKMRIANQNRTPESRQSQAEKLRGRPCPEHVKQRVSEFMKGNQYGLGNIPPNKGIPMTEEQKHKVSIAKKGKPNLKKRHPNREKARQLFESLPSDMSITEKRQIIAKTFSKPNYKTIWRWTTEWDK